MAETTTLSERGNDAVAPGSGKFVAPVPQTGQTPTGTEKAIATNPAQAALVLIAVVLMVAIVTWLGPILQPFLVAVFLYFATKAAVRYFIRWGFPTLLAYLTLFFVVSIAATVLALLAYDEGLVFQAQWPQYHQRILAVIEKVPGEASRPFSELFTTVSQATFKYVFERSLGLLELLMMTFFYLLFILLGADRLPQRVRRAFRDGRAEHIIAVTQKIGAGMERFMQVKTLVSVGMGVSAAVLLCLFGLRGWLLWGLLFFALNYITYIGSIIACVPPVALAYLDMGNPLAATAMSVLLVLNRFVWIDYLEVKMFGRHLNIDSILLFLWLAYWGWVWGVIGLILSFPMVASLKIVLEQLETTKGWAILMSDE